MTGRIARGLFILALFPCAVAASIGGFAVVRLVQDWLPYSEFSEIAPVFLAVYYGPGFLAASAAALFGIRPGRPRMVLTVIAGAWSALTAPTAWFAG